MNAPRMTDQTIIVAGGTGNVGSFIVRALLERGATVAVPSRSEKKANALREHLQAPSAGDGSGGAGSGRLHTFIGDVGDEAGAKDVRARILDTVGAPDGVVASLGRFVPAPSLLDTGAEALRQVLDGYTVGHFVVAGTFLPDLRASGGAYVFVNGPLAFEPWSGSGAGLVSIATAAQHMHFRAVAQELEDSAARVTELVSHAFIREKTTQPGSPLSGEEVGAYVAHLVSGEAEDIHGKSIHLKSPEQVREAMRA